MFEIIKRKDAKAFEDTVGGVWKRRKKLIHTKVENGRHIKNKYKNYLQ